MPFDAQTHRSIRVQHPDALRNMGLVPVPLKQVRHHKQTVLATWKQANFGKYDIARWQTIFIARYELLAELTTPLKRVRTNDVSPAPQAMINLAMEVERTVEDAKFRLDYFDTDPILHVRYDSDKRTACLGIWDNGKIIAIASPPSKWRKIWWTIS